MARLRPSDASSAWTPAFWDASLLPVSVWEPKRTPLAGGCGLSGIGQAGNVVVDVGGSVVVVVEVSVVSVVDVDVSLVDVSDESVTPGSVDDVGRGGAGGVPARLG